MLGYFPPIYPGELLYSLLARYHLHMGGTSTIHSMQALFGRRLTVASIDLPGSLKVLAQRIPSGSGWTADRIVDELTLLPYYVAFQSPRVARQARTALIEGQTKGLLVRLGMAAFRAGRVTRLRFCSACLQEMQARYGEYYWRRNHQLPGVFVCAEHGRVLKLSTVSATEQGRHFYVPATRKSCPWHAPALVNDVPEATLVALQRLALASGRLLTEAPRQRSFAQWARHYRESLASAGFVRGTCHIDQRWLQEAFWHHHQDIWPWLPALVKNQQFQGDWLAAMVRKHRKAFHSLQHLLLQDFLDSLEPVSGPFGKGPWRCLNPLAEHRDRLVIADLQVHRNHDHWVGVFACRCGYVYTRSWFRGEDRPRSPRFQSYGPLLAPALREMIGAGQPLRAIARRVELDPKTVVKLANALGIPVFWQIRAGEYRAHVGAARSVDCLDTHEVQAQPYRASTPRIDWGALDRESCREIGNVTAQLRSVAPPVRISLAQIERKLWSRGWLGRRAAKMPLTTACAREMAESVEQFQQRRASWIITQMQLAGEPIQAWRVLRKAGLTSRHGRMVDRILTRRFTRGGKQAA